MTSQVEDPLGRTTAAADPHKIEQVLAQLDELPAPSGMWHRLPAGEITSGINAAQLADLIVADPRLLADLRAILALPAVDPRPSRMAVEELIALHADGLRTLIHALKLIDCVEPHDNGPRGRLDRAEFWRHSLAVGCAASRIAQVLGGTINPLEALAAGLIHDIGKPAFDAVLPKSYARVLWRYESTDADISDIEYALLGVDHTGAGRRLAERWNLPKRLFECIWLHHHPPELLPAGIAAGRHVQIIQLADTLAREQRLGFSGTYHIARPSRLLAQQLGLPEEKRQAISDGLLANVSARADWLAARSDGGPSRHTYAAIDDGAQARETTTRLTEENRRLENKIRFFAAMDKLNETLPASANVREVCAAWAEAIQQACGVRTVVFVISDCGEWLDMGWAEGRTRSAIYQRPADGPEFESHGSQLARLAQAGAWLAPPPDAFADVVDRARGALGTGSIWFLPLVNQDRMVGGALLAGESATMTALSVEVQGLSALAHAVGLGIARAKDHVAARRLADELAEANRRSSLLEPELVRRQTLETTLAMAAGAAHELNNPLAVISGRAQLLRNRAATDDDRAVLQEIARQAQLASDIVTELMDFARPAEPIPESVDLRGFFETLRAELIGAGLLDDGSLSIDVAQGTPPVWFDRTQLSQLLKELLSNAVEATSPADRRLAVKAASDLTEEHVVVIVSDKGRGMTADVLGRAMDPFFSHRPAGRGRGLGLARVHRWVLAGKATIRIDSRPGQGTQVTLRLPVPPVEAE